jgi:hypothetical protein
MNAAAAVLVAIIGSSGLFISGSQVRALVRSPSSPCEPGIFQPGSDRPLSAGNPLSVSAPFGSLQTSVVSGGDFGGPVSASKNPVPGGPGSTEQTCGFVAPEPGLGDVDRAPGCPLRKSA